VYSVPHSPSFFDALNEETERGPAHDLTSVTLLSPLIPRNLFCCAGNYYRHVVEGGSTKPEKHSYSPRFFLKPQGVLIGPNESLRIPASSPHRIDWECELAVVIGRDARHVSADKAEQHIAGYTIFNDFSDRDFRLNPARTETTWDPFFDWLHGKWHDTFGAIGPFVITRDELPENLEQACLRLTVNGELRQNSTLEDMIFSPTELVAALSQIVTLRPGDVIATGTPGGVAAGGSSLWLKPGDLVEASIDAIGTLRTFVGSET
jgi:2,4-didehydro-3-deoxy-L-rhamnonate hydrolase